METLQIMKAHNIPKYDKDFYAWSLHTAKLLRQGKLAELDIEHIAEEVESMGKRDRRELVSRFILLLAHLLKWQFQPERRGNSWKATIRNQRFNIEQLLKDSPSLKYEIDKQIIHAYEEAMITASEETHLDIITFPKDCPFSLKQMLDDNFLPN